MSGEKLSGLRGRNVRQNHASVTGLPIHRSRHPFSGGKLKRVNDTNDFVEVSSGRRRIKNGKFQFLIGADDENRASGKRNALGVDFVGVQHAKLDGEFPFWVGDNGIRQRHLLSALSLVESFHVFAPTKMILDAVARQSDHFHVPGLELVLVTDDPGQFGGADWGVVSRM